MNKRSSAPARIAAVTSLAIAAIVVIVAIGAALGGGDSGSSKHGQSVKSAHKTAEKPHTPATYEVQSGDTLVSIAHRNGVSVREIEELNPQVDPQILIAGETLKLR
jgi:LysM repeat protein